MPISADEAKGWSWLVSILLGAIAGIFGAGATFQRLQDRIKKVEAAVIDDKSQAPKVVTFENCKRAMQNCTAERRDRRSEDRDNQARELQNIHEAIARQNAATEALTKSVAAMPATIVKELRAMGVLR